MLEAMAAHVVRRGHRRSWPELKAVITTAEVLTVPQRDLLADAFGVPIQNEYGCGEVGPIAYECERGSLHLMTENQIVAFILGVVLIFVLLIIGNISMLMSSSLVLPLEYIGIGKHYSSISRGVIDTRDLIYYASVIFLFLYLTARTVESRKWS